MSDAVSAAGGNPTPPASAEATLEAFEIRPSRAGSAGRSPTDELLIGGELLRRRAGVPWTVLRALLHLTLLFVPWFVLRMLVRFFIGFRRRATLRVGPEGLILRRESSILGRRMREEELSYPLSVVLAVGRVKRYRWLHLLVGLLCVVLGGSVGIVAIHDGIAGGYAPLALAGFGLLGLGVLVDLALNVLVPAARKRAIVELRVPREDLWLSGVEDDLADAFVRLVRTRAAAAHAKHSSDSKP